MLLAEHAKMKEAREKREAEKKEKEEKRLAELRWVGLFSCPDYKGSSQLAKQALSGSHAHRQCTRRNIYLLGTLHWLCCINSVFCEGTHVAK
jgi:hypothetical protein